MINYLKNWNAMRIIRLAAGIFIIASGIHANDWTFITVGVLFSAMPIFNFGCCSTNNCSTSTCRTPRTSSAKLKTEEINFEEIK